MPASKPIIIAASKPVFPSAPRTRREDAMAGRLRDDNHAPNGATLADGAETDKSRSISLRIRCSRSDRDMTRTSLP